MLDPSIFCSENPETNQERIARWNLKRWMHKAEDWWRLTHPEEDGLVVDPIVGDVVDVPAYLRRQAE